MKKNSLVILFAFITFSLLTAQNKQINWLSFEEADKQFKSAAKPILINFYYSENDSCRLMRDSTFSKEGIVNYINAAFYAINFNVNHTEEITFFDGQVYKPATSKKAYHTLVTKLLGEKPIFPCLIGFSRQAVGGVYPYFMNENRMYSFLIYYNEDIVGTTDYADYYKYYKKTFPEDGPGYSMSRVKVKWLSLAEALEKNKTAPKKIFLDININWRNACTIMSMSTYSEPKVYELLNKYFYPVQLAADTKDELRVFDTVYVNDGKYGSYHQLPVALLQGKMKFPAILIFNEQSKLISTNNAYFTPEEMEIFLSFYAENAFKKSDFKKFKTDFISKKNKSNTPK